VSFVASSSATCRNTKPNQRRGITLSNVIHLHPLHHRAERQEFMECLRIILRERAIAYQAYMAGDTPTFEDPVPEEHRHLFE
jgi:hypothetical protein